MYFFLVLLLVVLVSRYRHRRCNYHHRAFIIIIAWAESWSVYCCCFCCWSASIYLFIYYREVIIINCRDVFHFNLTVAEATVAAFIWASRREKLTSHTHYLLRLIIFVLLICARSLSRSSRDDLSISNGCYENLVNKMLFNSTYTVYILTLYYYYTHYIGSCKSKKTGMDGLDGFRLDQKQTGYK